MNKKVVFALMGAIFLVAGVFLPAVTIMGMTSISYINIWGLGGGLLITMAVISFIVAFMEQYRWIGATGIFSLGIIVYTFIDYQSNISGARSEMDSQIERVIWNEMSMVSLGWGWILLVIGIILLFAALVVRE